MYIMPKIKNSLKLCNKPSAPFFLYARKSLTNINIFKHFAVRAGLIVHQRSKAGTAGWLAPFGSYPVLPLTVLIFAEIEEGKAFVCHH